MDIFDPEEVAFLSKQASRKTAEFAKNFGDIWKKA